MKLKSLMSCALFLSIFNSAWAAEEALIKFENGNEVRKVKEDSYQYAIFSKDGKMISKKFSNIKSLTKNYHNKFTISETKPDIFVFNLALAATLQIFDQNGKESTIKIGDSLFTDALSVGEREIALMGTKGNIYLIDLEKAEIVDTKAISKNTLSIIKNEENKILIKDGLFSMKKVHKVDLNNGIKIEKSLDLEKMLNLSFGMNDGADQLKFFNNNHSIFFSNAGKGIFFDEELNGKIFETGKTSSKGNLAYTNSFIKLDETHKAYVNDNMDLVSISNEGEIEIFSAKLNSINEKNEDKKELEIKNSEVGCIKKYAEEIKSIKKFRLAKNVLLGVVTILNPPVGIGSMVIGSSDIISQRTPEEHAVVTMKLLDDATSRSSSAEIKMLTNVLSAARPDKFQSEDDVINALSEMNKDESACTSADTFRIHTLKDLILKMVK